MDALKKAVLERKRAAQEGNALKPGKTQRHDREEDEEESSSSSSSSDESDSSEDTSSSSSVSSEKSNTKEENVVKDEPASNDRIAFKKEYVSLIANPDAKRVFSWMVEIIDAWSAELENRSDEEKRSAKGRQASAAFDETLGHLEALAQGLRSGTLDSNILEHLVGIVYECDRREYRTAFDRYIQLTIGNVPWPIGVTMVGIHARSGREKIAESKIKHIMKDETVRAYLTSFKRLMSKCQDIHPPSAPSKRMN